MPCFRPLKAYRAPGGGVAWSSKAGYADLPLELPCGQCIDCRIKRSREWALRCVHEAQLHKRNCFLTLTYDDEHLPADRSLDVSHWQKFAKRLRKAVGPFRYFHCGEYTEKFRPHYHAILFGVDFADDRVPFRDRLFVSPLLGRTWGKGFHTIGQVSFESASYVARYCMKKATGDLAEERYTRVDPNTGECWEVKPEYVTMSRRPGIGAKWLEKFEGDVYPEDEVVHDGRRFRPPRFYDERLEEEALNKLKVKRRKAAKSRAEEVTDERLRVREECAEARLSRLPRKLD